MIERDELVVLEALDFVYSYSGRPVSKRQLSESVYPSELGLWEHASTGSFIARVGNALDRLVVNGYVKEVDGGYVPAPETWMLTPEYQTSELPSSDKVSRRAEELEGTLPYRIPGAIYPDTRYTQFGGVQE